MSQFIFRFILVASLFAPISSRALEIPEKCPKPDFNNRYIEVPISAEHPERGRFLTALPYKQGL